MSAIGDYIHYSAEGYRKHGTSYKGSFRPPYFTYSKVIQSRLKENKTKLSQQQLNEMAEIISAFMSNPNEKIKEDIYNNLNKQFGEKLKDALDNFNFETASVKGIDTSTKIGIVRAHKSEFNNKLYVDLREITNKINKLEENALKEISKNEADLKTFDDLIKQYEQLVGQSIEKMKNYDFKTNKKNLNLEIQSSNGISISKMRDNLNSLITQYAAYPDIVGIEGLGFENIIAAALSAADDDAENWTDKVVGDVTKQVSQFNVNKFFTNKEKLGENTFLIASYNQRAKVDVSLEWAGVDVKISAKNITLGDKQYAWIDAVSATPLIYLLQGINTEFINHFINLNSITKGMSDFNGLKSSVNSAMKQYLFYKGITGDTYNRKKSDIPNLLIVNDKTGKYKVKVYDMQFIVNELFNKMDKVKVQIGGDRIMSKDFKFKSNKWVGDNKNSRIEALQRIQNIISEVHALKVNIAFNYAAVDK